MHSQIQRTLTATALSTDGRAIARDNDGIVVFVKNMLPEETGKVTILTQKSSFKSGILSELEVSSPHRIEAPCAFVKKCGGCQLQHISAQMQTKYKAEWLLETLKRVGKWELKQVEHATEILSIVSLKKDHYRRRVRLHFDGQNLGFKESGSNKITDIPYCYITSEKINAKIPFIKEKLLKSFAEIKNKKIADDLECEIEVTDSDDGEIVLYVNSITPPQDAVPARPVTPRLDRGVQLKYSDLINKNLNIKNDQNIELSHPELATFNLQKRSFVQPHIECIKYYYTAMQKNIELFLQNNHAVLKQIEKKFGTVKTWDLYAGGGIFTPLPVLAGNRSGIKIQCIGVEGIHQAIASLKENCKNLNIQGKIQNVDNFIVHELQKKSSDPEKYQAAHVIILDPPRMGVGLETMKTLVEVCPQTCLVLYLACDPASFARDTALLLKAGFRLNSIKLFDSFSHTIHYEVLGCFEREEMV